MQFKSVILVSLVAAVNAANVSNVSNITTSFIAGANIDTVNYGVVAGIAAAGAALLI